MLSHSHSFSTPAKAEHAACQVGSSFGVVSSYFGRTSTERGTANSDTDKELELQVSAKQLKQQSA